MTKQEIGQLIAVVAATYQNFQISPVTAEIWAEIIGGMDYDLAKKSLKVYISQGKDFAPNPGHIKQIAIQLTTPIEHEETAGEAWEKVLGVAANGMSAMGHLSYRAKAVARQIGWERIRYGNIETDLPFARAAFVRAFDDMAERDAEIEEQTKLPALATNLIEMSKPKAIA